MATKKKKKSTKKVSKTKKEKKKKETIKVKERVELKKREINILEHELVPKHEICNEEEVKQLLERYNITKEQLPKILSTDPVVKALGAKPGDVIKIIRDSKISGRTIYYRVVIEK